LLAVSLLVQWSCVSHNELLFYKKGMKRESCEFGPVLHVPLEADGFHKSFEVDQKQKILDFFREYGVVIIRDVVGAVQRRGG
jgi:hypothetical protein